MTFTFLNGTMFTLQNLFPKPLVAHLAALTALNDPCISMKLSMSRAGSLPSVLIHPAVYCREDNKSPHLMCVCLHPCWLQQMPH